VIKKLLRRVGIGRAYTNLPEFKDSGLIPRVDIRGPDGALYLTRWHLFAFLDRQVFLHQVHRSDHDRSLHDHPWPFVSLLLLGGGYREHRHDGGFTDYGPGGLNARLDASLPHRLELPPGKPQWTLVFVGKKVRSWGFHVPEHLLGEAAHDYRPGQVPGTRYVPWKDHAALGLEDQAYDDRTEVARA